MSFYDSSGTVRIKKATLLSVEEATKIPTFMLKFPVAWWLRSKGDSSDKGVVVGSDGFIYRRGYEINSIFRAVRPALVLEAHDRSTGNTIHVGGHSFTIVLPHIALADESIGISCFDRTSNDYESSEIKKKVDEWFQTIISVPEPADWIVTSGATLLSVEETKKIPTAALAYAENWWWLRTEGCRPYFAAAIENNGSSSYMGKGKSYDIGAVRPALYLESDDYQVGNRFSVGNYNFTVVLPRLALLDSHIEMSHFDSNSNKYESSEIRKIVDRWFDNEIKTDPTVIYVT